MNTKKHKCILLKYRRIKKKKKVSCHLFLFSYQQQMAFSLKYLNTSTEKKKALHHTEAVMKL